MIAPTTDAGEVRQFGCPPGISDISYAFTVGPDKMIYLATISSDRAKFLRFDPAKPEKGIINLGEPSSTETFVNQGAILVGRDGKIYAGTYPGAKLISYDPKTGELRDHGRMDETQTYNKQLAQGKGGWIYNGVGVNRPRIIAYDPSTGVKREVAAGKEGVPGTGYVYGGTDGHAYGSAGTHHFRLLDGEAAPIPLGEKAPQPTMALADGRQLMSAQITDYANQECTYRLLDPTSHTPASFRFTFEGSGVPIFTLGEGPKQLVYGSTILPMEIFSYDPAASKMTYLGHLGSGELYSIKTWRGIPFFCSYPGSAVWRYDASRPWDPGWGLVRNPSMVVGKYGLGKGHLRPYAIIEGPDDKLYIGSVSGYGTSGGGMAVFDPLAGRRVKNYREPFEEYGVVSLAYDPGSGTIFGGSKGLFVWDPAKEQMVHVEPIPTPNALCLAGGRLFTVSGQTLRVFDIAQRQVVHEASIGTGSQRSNALSLSTDGLIYGLTDKELYTIDPKTYAVTRLAELPVTARCGWVINETGIYFGSADHVWRYRPQADEFDDLGVAAATANLYGHMVGPDAEGNNTMLYFLFKTGKGLFISQVRPDPPGSKQTAQLLANPDFEAESPVGETPALWQAPSASYGRCELTDEQNHTPGGTRSVKVTIAGANGGNCLQALPSRDKLPMGKDLFVSAWVYIPSDQQITQVRLYAHIEGGHPFIRNQVDIGPSFPRDTWVQIRPNVTRVRPQGFYTAAILHLAVFGEKGHYAYFDDAAIQYTEPGR